MKSMLTSFGIADSLSQSTRSVIVTRGPSHNAERDLFLRMPPVNMHHDLHQFSPEYSTLLLFDRIVLDLTTFDLLQFQPHPAYALVADTMKALQSEGFLELVAYSDILEQNEDLLNVMLENDLNSLNQWIGVLHDSLLIWDRFVRSALTEHPDIDMDPDIDNLRVFIHDSVGMAGYLLKGFQDRHEEDLRRSLREVVTAYLKYVNSTLILSNEIGAGFHDWGDFLPFYRRKFLSLGHEELPGERHIEASRTLFEVSFPNLAVKNPTQLLKILQHKRVNELRALVQEAVDGKVTFDVEFARSVFTEAIQGERTLAKQRRLVGFITAPIGFIPMIGNLAQIGIQEVAATVLERKLAKRFRWFYMLSDLG